ncbi:Type II secretory pathway, component ExeA (predicted ATPase) [Hahella chejuensis KCTC 2396]|uniref:Type II secretory pathway, component ExeA (Predicted ATPase) n=2 Tax=Hahella chejuensis TaxID=158327 RepID=Q2SIT3_HAHCH|nr:Type II secretory pathway, component ExeA (predicted ATPase) [Hahella chejuensis KCTC 2396]
MPAPTGAILDSMYEAFFGLKESPFSIAPDPRYLYMSERHREALAHLLYGIEREGGFVLLTGEVGTGKTTTCRCFLQRVPKNTDIAFILYPKLTARELLATICDELHIAYPAQCSIKILIDVIHKHLLKAHAAGKHTALVIDEAQNLSSDVLEQLRLLTNLETEKKKLLQIILLGQPELKELLQRPELRQLVQRITARYHLDALSPVDVRAYIGYRLSVAGCRKELFSNAAINKVYKLSRGIPRIINLICDRALLGAYSENSQVVTPALVKMAGKEIGLNAKRTTMKWLDNWVVKGFAAGALAGGLTLVLGLSLNQDRRQPDKAIGAVAQASALAGEGEGQVQRDEGTLKDAALPSEEKGAATEASASGESATAAAQTAAWVSPVTTSASKVLGAYRPKGDNTRKAYQSVMHIWGLADSAGARGLVCEFVETRGLRCLHRQGNWRSLLQLNRPAVLKLMNNTGETFSAALISVSADQSAVIELDGERHTIPLAELDGHWQGDYSILWKVPPYASMVIQPGEMQGENEWIDGKIKRVNEIWLSQDEKPSLEPLPDTSLKDRVRWFQQEVGILPDGIPGAITLIMLNSWTDSTAPLLIPIKRS